MRVERQGTVPLSYAQERLWFIDQLEPNNALYNMPMAVRLKGLLNVEALERVLREVVRRHEVLRTRIEIQDGRGLQVIEGEWGGKLEVVDLSGLEEAEREGEVRRRAVAEASKPFDLSQGRLLRAELLQLGEQEHVLLATMHHIVSDGWSMGVLVKEVGTLYEAYVQGEPSPSGSWRLVCGLCGMAARVVEGGGAGGTTGVLEGAAGRDSGAGVADGSDASGGGEL